MSSTMETDTSSELEFAPPYKTDFTGTRVLVWDHRIGSALYRLGYYGQPVGIRKPKSPYFERPLELDLLEARYLYEKDIIHVYYQNKKLPLEDFIRHSQEIFLNYNDLYLVYKDLRDKNYIVRPGLKFGVNFSVYQRGPGIDHAPYLVAVLYRNQRIEPIDLVRAGRLANTVKKRYVIATILPDETVKYYVFEWFKP